MSPTSSSQAPTEVARSRGRDTLGGLAFVALGIGLVLYGRSLHAANMMGDVGPGFFPMLIGAAMTVLGAVLAYPRRAAPDDGGEPLGERRALAVLFVAAACGYVALFGAVGFSYATVVYLFLAMALLGRRTVGALLVYAASATLLSGALGWLLVRLLSVPLTGVWFIN